jgi:DNA gyrase/topoisomerase IV subunit A
LKKVKPTNGKKCFRSERNYLADDKDEVIGMVSVNDMNSEILVVSENGYGKRSSR